jgi:hypothetical protein
MTKENESRAKAKPWQAEDTALLRAARKIIRLYDLRQAKLMVVKAESIAHIIAQELNSGAEAFDLAPSPRGASRGEGRG